MKIRNNKNIKGINVNNIEFRISQYAYDTSIILDGSESSLNQTILELERFSSISGLHVNFEKKLNSMDWLREIQHKLNSNKMETLLG